MYLMIDNYDSFVYNLARYMEELGERVELIRNDRISAGQVETMMLAGTLEGIIISPGPKSPKDCGNCREIVEQMAGRVPILGVCLGHQIIGHVFGAKVVKGVRPMHGKVTRIRTTGEGLFEQLPREYSVTRYHSLIVSDEQFPEELQVDARSEDGVIMALSHRKLPVYGVQFHPEAVLTEYGHELLGNFTKICRKWWNEYENDDSKTAVL
ncbi:MAG: aminodeoxychorismate/anthranilate synthase component II [Lachnospiraceae bacterium]|nr:aminodeoxychorismate/anthranilate synthase component II [Lachnospiraceae bacterium]